MTRILSRAGSIAHRRIGDGLALMAQSVVGSLIAGALKVPSRGSSAAFVGRPRARTRAAHGAGALSREEPPIREQKRGAALARELL